MFYMFCDVYCVVAMVVDGGQTPPPPSLPPSPRHIMYVVCCSFLFNVRYNMRVHYILAAVVVGTGATTATTHHC